MTVAEDAEQSVLTHFCRAAKPSRIDSFMALISPFGVLESARTGKESQVLSSGIWTDENPRFDGLAPYPVGFSPAGS